ncbi:unnamed protein product, partial [Prorocentrum cordatum]
APPRAPFRGPPRSARRALGAGSLALSRLRGDGRAAGFTWELCCDTQWWGPQGNLKCWAPASGFTLERCCPLWPLAGNEVALPQQSRALLHFGLSSGDLLPVVQVPRVRGDGELPGWHPAWVGGVLWAGGVLLGRWADACAGADFWPRRRVLELAAGVGVPAQVARRFGANVTATDVSPASLWALRRNLAAAAAGRGGRVERARVLPLDVRDEEGVRRFRREVGTFDVVLGSGCMRAPPWIPRKSKPPSGAGWRRCWRPGAPPSS